ncbi:RNA polymerase sigma factor [Rhodococcus sp. NPDC058521]|uniref:RNA polymerase sigma factor n=1 Tax=Rhodococcus sp. NPDC058521 TaxID=3346536 RepID=UPI003665AC7A
MKIPFERAVEQHGATVLRVCRAVLGSGPDADDAWSETFLAALRSWDVLADDTNVQAWLVRVAKRKAIDVTRARGRSPIPTETLPDVADHSVTLVEDSDLWDRVSALPERQRLAVAYHYFGGVSHVETAELTGSTPSAVRRAAADGIDKLRASFEPGTQRKRDIHERDEQH